MKEFFKKNIILFVSIVITFSLLSYLFWYFFDFNSVKIAIFKTKQSIINLVGKLVLAQEVYFLPHIPQRIVYLIEKIDLTTQEIVDLGESLNGAINDLNCDCENVTSTCYLPPRENLFEIIKEKGITNLNDFKNKSQAFCQPGPVMGDYCSIRDIYTPEAGPSSLMLSREDLRVLKTTLEKELSAGGLEQELMTYGSDRANQLKFYIQKLLNQIDSFLLAAQDLEGEATNCSKDKCQSQCLTEWQLDLCFGTRPQLKSLGDLTLIIQALLKDLGITVRVEGLKILTPPINLQLPIISGFDIPLQAHIEFPAIELGKPVINFPEMINFPVSLPELPSLPPIRVACPNYESQGSAIFTSSNPYNPNSFSISFSPEWNWQYRIFRWLREQCLDITKFDNSKIFMSFGGDLIKGCVQPSTVVNTILNICGLYWQGQVRTNVNLESINELKICAELGPLVGPDIIEAQTLETQCNQLLIQEGIFVPSKYELIASSCDIDLTSNLNWQNDWDKALNTLIGTCNNIKNKKSYEVCYVPENGWDEICFDQCKCDSTSTCSGTLKDGTIQGDIVCKNEIHDVHLLSGEYYLKFKVPISCRYVPLFTREPISLSDEYGSNINLASSTQLGLIYDFPLARIGCSAPPNIPRIVLPEIDIPDITLFPPIDLCIPPIGGFRVNPPKIIFEPLKLPEINLCNLDQCGNFFPPLSFQLIRLTIPPIELPIFQPGTIQVSGLTLKLPALRLSPIVFPQLTFPFIGFNLPEVILPQLNIQLNYPELSFLFAVLLNVDYEALSDLFLKIFEDLLGIDLPLGECFFANFSTGCFWVTFNDIVISWPRFPQIPEIPLCREINNYCAQIKQHIQNFAGLVKAVETAYNTKLAQIQTQINTAITKFNSEVTNQLVQEYNKVANEIANQIAEHILYHSQIIENMLYIPPLDIGRKITFPEINLNKMLGLPTSISIFPPEISFKPIEYKITIPLPDIDKKIILPLPSFQGSDIGTLLDIIKNDPSKLLNIGLSAVSCEPLEATPKLGPSICYLSNYVSGVKSKRDEIHNTCQTLLNLLK